MNNELRPRAMRDTFFARLHAMMTADPAIFVLSADFGAPTLDAIRNDYPRRFINVGIAEQNLVAVAAGLALEGHKVVGYAIAPFITMRCFEQIRVNLAILSRLRPLSVTLLGVGAGMSYEVSGPTHHCIEDLSIMSALPGVHVWSPSDAATSGDLAAHCVGSSGIHYIRCDAKPQARLPGAIDPARGLRHIAGDGPRLVVATGYMTQLVHGLLREHAELATRITLLDVFHVNGFDETVFAARLHNAADVLVLQEAVRDGGLDARVRRLGDDFAPALPIRSIGIAGDYRFEIGPRDSIHHHYGIARAQVLAALNAPITTVMPEHAA
jgi:transketolase